MNRLAWALIMMGAAAAAQARPAAEVAPATASSVTDARAKVRQELDEFGRRIDALEADARRAGTQTRERLDAAVKDLRVDKADAEREFAKLESAGESARKRLSKGLDRAMVKLRTAYRKAVAKPAK